MPDEPIVINGGYGEGGSALLRTSLAMSALTQQAVRVHNVRGAMRKQGLQSEDLAYLHALSTACTAKVTGDEVGECDLTFTPTRPARALNQRIDIHAHESGTVPGNALIVLESLIPVLARCGAYSKLVVQGETHNPNTLTYDVFERVTLAAHRRQGIYGYPHLAVAGFGYGAKGEVGLELEPSAVQPLPWSKRGELISLNALITIAELPEEVGRRGSERAEGLLKDLGGELLDVQMVQTRARSPGAFVCMWAEFEQGIGCGSACGQRGVRMETVVEQAFQGFLEFWDSEATVDSFLADQLLLPAVLADGETVIKTPRVTRRLVSMAWAIKQFMPVHITILGQEGSPGTITASR